MTVIKIHQNYSLHGAIIMKFMHSFGEPVSILLSSQVAVEDGDFVSLALKSRPISIKFKVENVSAT